MAKFIYRMQNILNIKLRLETQAKTEYAENAARLAAEEEKISIAGCMEFPEIVVRSHKNRVSVYASRITIRRSAIHLHTVSNFVFS